MIALSNLKNKLINKLFLIFFCFFLILYYSCESKNSSKSLQYKLLQKGEENYPVFISLHGEMGNMEDFRGEILRALKGFPVYGINGPIDNGNNLFNWFSFNHYKFNDPNNKGTLHDLITNNKLDELNSTLFNLEIIDETYNTCTKQLKEVIEQIKSDSKTKEVYLLGFSQGAMVAYELICKYPELVNGMISLMGVPLNFPKGEIPKYEHLKFFAINGDQDKIIKSDGAMYSTNYFISKSLSKKDSFIHKFYDIDHLDILESDKISNTDFITDLTTWIDNLKPKN